jgi:tyrosyl-tRNA synthetase
MSKGDGMSFAEFTYPIMQAWDWWHMFRTKGIQMQIGGSDQYGNITAGIDAVKFVAAHHPEPDARDEARAVGEPFGFTVPLLTTSSGQKFGKSAGNAIWLDNEETSAFQLYGYFLRTSDLDVEKYLKMFTFLPLEKITTVMEEHIKSPHERKAQHILARELLELVHGEHEARMAESQHRTLFQKGPDVPLSSEVDADAKAGIITANNRPKVNIKLPRSVIFQRSVSKVMFAVGLAASGSQGHRLIESGGAYIGGRNPSNPTAMNDGSITWVAIKHWKPEEAKAFLIHDDLLLFRRSKHNVRIVQVVSDEEYVMSGESYPGMSKAWKMEVLARMAAKASVTEDERAAIQALMEDDALWAKNLTSEEPEADSEKRKVKVRHIKPAESQATTFSPESDTVPETPKA